MRSFADAVVVSYKARELEREQDVDIAILAVDIAILAVQCWNLVTKSHAQESCRRHRDLRRWAVSETVKCSMAGARQRCRPTLSKQRKVRAVW